MLNKMSNQVVSSKFDKYLASYTLSRAKRFSTNQTFTTNVSANVIFNVNQPSFVSDDFTYNEDTGVVTIVNKGMYSIMASVVLQDATSPTLNDLDFSVYLSYTYLGTEYLLNQTVLRVPARGVTPGSDQVVIPISCVVFCYPDQVLSIKVTNLAASNLLVKADNSTQLMIQRIA